MQPFNRNSLHICLRYEFPPPSEFLTKSTLIPERCLRLRLGNQTSYRSTVPRFSIRHSLCVAAGLMKTNMGPVPRIVPEGPKPILNQYERTGLLSPSSGLHVHAARAFLAASCVHIVRPGHVFCEDQVFPAKGDPSLGHIGQDIRLLLVSRALFVSILRNLPATKASSCCEWSKTMASPSIHTLQCIRATRVSSHPLILPQKLCHNPAVKSLCNPRL